MDVTTILLLLLVGAIATYFSGDKLASKVALLFGVASFGATIFVLSSFNAGQDVSFFSSWINEPKVSFALKDDELAIIMVLLTTSLLPIIIYSSFGNE